uniref:uncharacterized protein LOC117161656 n=1 Tax=Bombus vancouverensis nearcticus TaxID=2705178 RepID=UPI00143B52AD|nr:uncharacterized protein LOC117161656 [Bombus vancouverensis nearcticus]
MEELSFVPLQTENHYIIIPTKNMQIDVLCKTHKILEIKQPSLISSKTGCIITHERNVMKIGETHKNISYEIKIKNSSHSFKEIDIPTLEEILETAPKVTHNFNQCKANLDTLQTQVNSLQSERRINSLREYGTSTLQILGHIALGLGTVYILYKCKLFECLSRVIPKNPTGPSLSKTLQEMKITESFKTDDPPEPYASTEQSESKKGEYHTLKEGQPLRSSDQIAKTSYKPLLSKQ